jgi:hypothetical protein
MRDVYVQLLDRLRSEVGDLGGFVAWDGLAGDRRD